MTTAGNSRSILLAPLCLSLILALTSALSLSSVKAVSAAGTTIVVTSNSPGTGGPKCKLRDAIKAANTAKIAGGCDGRGGGPYTIELAANALYSLNQVDNEGEMGKNGLPQITGKITVNGHGAKIQRDPWVGSEKTFRFFQVNAGAVLHLNDLEIDNGETTHGGAIYSNGTVTIRNGSFTRNRSQCGGVVMNNEVAKLSITNSSFSFNDANE